MAKYRVRYFESIHIDRDIEASSKEEAERIMLEAISSGKIDTSYADIDDSGCRAFEIKDTDEKK